MIFTLLHCFLTGLAHIATGFAIGTPILAFHTPLSLPLVAFIMYLTLALMRDIKQKIVLRREFGPQLKMNKDSIGTTKAKHLYGNKEGVLPPVTKSYNHNIFIGSGKDAELSFC